MAHHSPMCSGTAAALAFLHIGLRSTAAHFFAVDNWKVSPALTINARVSPRGQRPAERSPWAASATSTRSSMFRHRRVDLQTPRHPDSCLPDNYEGPAPEGFPRKNSTLLNDPVQLHPEPRIGFGLAALLIARYRHQKWLWHRTRTASTSLGAGTTSGFQSALPGHEELDRRRQCRIQPPTSRFPYCRCASSFPNFVGAMLPGPPYTGDRTPQLAAIIDPDFKDATIQHYGLEIQYQRESYPVLARLRRCQRHSPCRITEQQSARPGQSRESCQWVDHQLGRECRRASSFSRRWPRLCFASRAAEPPTTTLCKQRSTSD